MSDTEYDGPSDVGSSDVDSVDGMFEELQIPLPIEDLTLEEPLPPPAPLTRAPARASDVQASAAARSSLSRMFRAARIRRHIEDSTAPPLLPPHPPRFVRTVRSPRYLGIDDLLPLPLLRPPRWHNPFSSIYEHKYEEKKDTEEDYSGIINIFAEYSAKLEKEPLIQFEQVINHVKFYLSRMNDRYSFLKQSFVDFTYSLIRYIRKVVLEGRYVAFEEAWSIGLGRYSWEDICGFYWSEAVSDIQKLLH